jgi:inner membrane protein involved in colicin E2 resistance
MAENTHNAGEDAPAGTMDISEHVKTWLAFWSAAKWSALLIALVFVLLAIFRTHNG